MQTPATLQQIEADLRTLETCDDLQVAFSPQIAKQQSEVPLHEASAIYWVSTIWHNPKPFTFSIEGPGDEIERLRHAAAWAPGRLLALLPHGRIAATSRRGAAIFREQLLVGQDNWPDLAVNNSAALFCLDAHPDGLPKQLYVDTEGRVLKGRDHFRGTLTELIRSIIDEDLVRGRLLNNLEALTTIAYELFKNTHDHAVTWIDNALLPASCRGIYVRYYSKQQLEAALGSPPSGQNQADAFARRLVTTGLTGPQQWQVPVSVYGLMELSIFDTGPGFAQRFLKKPISEISGQEQFDAVIQCFNQGQSSMAGSVRGFGLWKVLRYLRDLRGFIRVRTNQIHAYRDFLRYRDYKLQTTDYGASVPQETLFDWELGLTSSARLQAPIRGSVVSILLPVSSL